MSGQSEIYKNGVFKFYVEYKLFGLNKNGYGTFTLSKDGYKLVIPSGVSIPGLPDTVLELQSKLYPYTNYIYSVKASGNFPDCSCINDGRANDNYLVLQYFSVKVENNEGPREAYVVRDASIPRANVVCGFLSPGGTMDSEWLEVGYYGPELVKYIQIGRGCTNTGCCDYNDNLMGDITIILRINFSIDFIGVSGDPAIGYCTQPGKSLIHDTLCYNYLSHFITDVGSTATLDTYLKSYCAGKFPGDGLSLFNAANKGTVIDDADYNICACNMPESEYEIFLTSLTKAFPTVTKASLGSIRPNCILPACALSNFKNSTLGTPPDACPVPLCLSIVNLKDSKIEGDVEINQSADCKKIGFDKKPDTPGNPDTPNQTPPYIPPAKQEKEETAQGEISTIDDTTIIIIVVVVIIVVVAIIVGIYFGVKKSRASPVVT